jgi:hypothetical protein
LDVPFEVEVAIVFEVEVEVEAAFDFDVHPAWDAAVCAGQKMDQK